ncbi:MAG: KH domain-containing protein [Deltaproteobacteria bacterium]|nr:KH domain-containing protein [Deltaproteobacteria bacterium]
MAGDKLQDLIAYIASSLVDDPDAVEVNVVEEERTVVLELTVAPDDLGKVISSTSSSSLRLWPNAPNRFLGSSSESSRDRMA